MQQIVERISARLEALGRTRHWLAAQIGCGSNTVYNWFGDKERAPERAQLGPLAVALETTTDYLLGVTDDPTLVRPPTPIASASPTLDSAPPSVLNQMRDAIELVRDDLSLVLGELIDIRREVRAVVDRLQAPTSADRAETPPGPSIGSANAAQVSRSEARRSREAASAEDGPMTPSTLAEAHRQVEPRPRRDDAAENA
jgi:hypothetical protein